MKNIDETIKTLQAGVVQITPLEHFKKKLAKNIPLKIKLGADPTAPDLHLGHAVALSKLKQFQDLGHEVIFLIGDFTARIGDPSGRSKTRPPLTEEEITKNSQTYFKQVSKILDPEKTIIRYNSEWLSKLNFIDIIQLVGKTTVARIIERDDFQNRLKDNISIGFHELLYPIMQGYDSVALDADVEVGGTDQTFNLMMGRYLQEQYGKEPQVILTLPLLEGLDGVQKMSKSYGNYVGLWEKPENAFGKLMSISDELMWRYYSILLNTTDEKIKNLQKQVNTKQLHPMQAKKDMSCAIVKRFWGEQESQKALVHFEALFQKQDYSQAQEIQLNTNTQKEVWIIDLLKQLGAIKSSSEGKRLIESKSVSINQEHITNFKELITPSNNDIIKVGKHRIYKIVFQ